MGSLFEVIATADIGGSQARGAQVQFVIGIDRFVTEAERVDMLKVLRGEKEAPDMREPCGAIRLMKGDPVMLEYAYARKVDDFNYKVILATREDMPFTNMWPAARMANSDLKIIQLNVNQNSVGTGVMVLGGEISWNDSEDRIELDTGLARPITLSSISARDVR